MTCNNQRGSVVLNDQQQVVLHDLVRHYLTIIINHDDVDHGTKVLYLERAITQNSTKFLRSLDLLYQPKEHNKKLLNLVIIHALKLINDLYCNALVRPKLDALSYYLRLDNVIYEASCYQIPIETIVHAFTKNQMYSESADIRAQKKMREYNESSSIRNSKWRQLLGLPKMQLSVSFVQDNLSERNESDLERLTTQEWLNFPTKLTWQYSAALVALVMNPYQGLSVKEAINKLEGLDKQQLLSIAPCTDLKGGFLDKEGACRLPTLPKMRELNREQAITLKHFKKNRDEIGIQRIIHWEDNTAFNANHRTALIQLTTNEHNRLRLDQAIDEIKGLKGEELLAVELIAENLGALPNMGAALRAWDDDVLFNWEHRRVLVALLSIYHKQLPMEQAVAEIQRLTPKQLKALEEINYSSDNFVVGLGDALRGWGKSVFDSNHMKALIQLVDHAIDTESLIDIKELVNKIKGKSGKEALDIAERGSSIALPQFK